MTFYEAAVAVLREAGRPLHFKKITALSIQQDLLSHVGKKPEDTMSARLTQEAKKPSDQSAIEEVRPGVFGIREGVDLGDVAQTIKLREPVVEEEDEPAAEEEAVDESTDDAGEDEQSRDDDSGDSKRSRGRRRGGRGRKKATDDNETVDEDDSETSSDSDDDEDGSKRRRGRRGGRGRRSGSERAQDDGETESRSSRDKKSRDDEKPRERSGRRGGRRDEKRDERPARHGASAASTDVPLSVITAAAYDALSKASSSPLSASSVAKALGNAGIGALDKLGKAGVRDTLMSANARLATAGRPPMFEEVKPNFWALAQASGSSLAKSYASLDAWQSEHRKALESALLKSLSELDDDALGTLATLLMDRLGYRDLQFHDDGAGTVAALASHGLTSVRIALRIVGADSRVNADAVTAFRGSLHRYSAAEGVIIALGSVDKAAREETEVANVAPVSVVDAEQFARQLIDNGVGLRTFSVEVSCVDDALFRELGDS